MAEKLPARIKYWLTEAKHDCFFVIGIETGPKERIGTIKSLLMGDSEPFRAMLQDSELAEKGDICVTDIQPETFKNFLKCVYGGSNFLIPSLTYEQNIKLLHVAEKYLVNDLINELSDHLKREFSPEKIFVALSYTLCCEEKLLKSKIQDCLKFNFEKLSADERFFDLSATSITYILQQECIYVKEIEIWKSVLQWAKHNSDSTDGQILRLFVNDLLVYIRFLTMDYNEFAERVVSSEVLTEEEVSDICKALVLGKACSMEHLCNNRNNRFDIHQASPRLKTYLVNKFNNASISCTITSISHLQIEYSKTYEWAGNLWTLRVEHNNNAYLAVYLSCNGKSLDWNFNGSVGFTLINQSGNKSHVESLNSVSFSSNGAREFGCSTLQSWNTLINTHNGFVVDDSIIVMANIRKA